MADERLWKTWERDKKRAIFGEKIPKFVLDRIPLSLFQLVLSAAVNPNRDAAVFSSPPNPMPLNSNQWLPEFGIFVEFERNRREAKLSNLSRYISKDPYRDLNSKSKQRAVLTGRNSILADNNEKAQSKS